MTLLPAYGIAPPTAGSVLALGDLSIVGAPLVVDGDLLDAAKTSMGPGVAEITVSFHDQGDDRYAVSLSLSGALDDETAAEAVIVDRTSTSIRVRVQSASLDLRLDVIIVKY